MIWPLQRSACSGVRTSCAAGASLAVLVMVSLATSCRPDDPASKDPGNTGSDAAAVGRPAWVDLAGVRLADLPGEAPGSTTHFVTSEQCRQCHQANDTAAGRDAKGRDVSPGTTWRRSMMGLAARDPYYLAVFAAERAAIPAARATIDATCTRCHAPAASVETGRRFGFDALAGDRSAISAVGRAGVTCTACHQILADGLGTSAAFTGGFRTTDARVVFGPHPAPLTDPMGLFVSYTPAYSEHITKSSFCSTCHTVITRTLDANGELLGPQFPEQTAYLEWQNSAFEDETSPPGPRATSCQACHMPATDDDGAPIRAAVAVRPAGLQAREPFGRHLFLGGNSHMLRLMAKGSAFTGSAVLPSELEDEARRVEGGLGAAARIAVEGVKRGSGAVELRVRVINETGHKLPTGYPSRRMWLHVAIRDGDRVTWESGAWDGWGRITARGKVVDVAGAFQPHRDVVGAEEEAQIWEGVPGDVDGKVAALPLEAARYLKDDRLLPEGWQDAHKAAPYTRPVGVTGDPDFGSSDGVIYRISPAPPAGATIAIELVFQSIRPHDLELLARRPNPAALRFFDLAKETPPLPVAEAQRPASSRSLSPTVAGSRVRRSWRTGTPARTWGHRQTSLDPSTAALGIRVRAFQARRTTRRRIDGTAVGASVRR